MGGDHAPAVPWTARWPRRAPRASASISSGPRRVDRARAGAAPDAAALDVAVVDAPDVVEMAESPAQALRRKPRASIRVAAELVARGDAAALVSAGHTGATVWPRTRRSGCCRASIVPALAPVMPTAARGRPCCSTPGRRSSAGPQHLRAVRGDGRRVRPAGAGRRGPARRAAVDRGGGDEGQRADARGAPAAEGRRRCASSATSRRATSTAATPT
jgi:hypothetical protein